MRSYWKFYFNLLKDYIIYKNEVNKDVKFYEDANMEFKDIKWFLTRESLNYADILLELLSEKNVKKDKEEIQERRIKILEEIKEQEILV